MTKRELLDLLEDVPDDARMLIAGAEIGAVAYDPTDSTIVLDEKSRPFLDSPCQLLYDEAGYQ